MNSLAAIQKTFRVFAVLSGAAMILSFVWAGLTALGLLCGVVWYSGGAAVMAGRETLLCLTAANSLSQMMGVLLTDLVFALTDGVLFLLAWRYFRQEQADGTPFTRNGAEQVRQLGIRSIVLPLAAVILAALFREAFDLTAAVKGDDLWGVTLGIVLILTSLVFRYGAELEGRKSAAA